MKHSTPQKNVTENTELKDEFPFSAPAHLINRLKGYSKSVKAVTSPSGEKVMINLT